MERDSTIPVFQAAGGEAAFYDLAARFYQRVERDPILRPLYPSQLDRPRRHLALFLIQFFGGPRLYAEERGVPALRIRHEPFAIDQEVRDRWVEHMSAAVKESEFSADVERELLAYFERAASALINSPRAHLPIRPRLGD